MKKAIFNFIKIYVLNIVAFIFITLLLVRFLYIIFNTGIKPNDEKYFFDVNPDIDYVFETPPVSIIGYNDNVLNKVLSQDIPTREIFTTQNKDYYYFFYINKDYSVHILFISFLIAIYLIYYIYKHKIYKTLLVLDILIFILSLNIMFLSKELIVDNANEFDVSFKIDNKVIDLPAFTHIKIIVPNRKSHIVTISKLENRIIYENDINTFCFYDKLIFNISNSNNYSKGGVWYSH